MKFIQQHPTFKSYEHENFKMSSTPTYGFISDLSGFVHSQIINNSEDDEVNLLAWRLQNQLAAEARVTPIENTYYQILFDEIMSVFRKLNERGFHHFMDGLAILIKETNNLDDVNEFLESKEIGYFASLWNGEVEWLIREDTEDQAESLVEALEVIEFDYQNTRDHIKQAIQQLQNASNSRNRKDALRDALSAVEAYINSIAGSTDFHKSFRTLAEQIDAPSGFIRDAQSLWSKIHEFHPDIRHGNEDASLLELPEALYYIDRLMAHIKYIHRKRS